MFEMGNGDNVGKICDLCQYKSGGTKLEELYGPFMEKNELTVHYFCLLLSTNLPQNALVSSGINGFQVRDIRKEIAAAKKRLCTFCEKINATIGCKNCKEYFHIKCGLQNGCLFTYSGEFASYCDKCFPANDFQKNAREKWHARQPCFICKQRLGGIYTPTDYLYGACCGNGFVHRSCMQKYASFAGYYLCCIWCRSTDFRESIKQQGIFVPDREARWETRHAYRDLHRGHRNCDVKQCLCPNGRQYASKTWNLINCTLCGAFGVHFPKCLPPTAQSCTEEDFECSTCALSQNVACFERSICVLSEDVASDVDVIDTSLYVQTQKRSENFETPGSMEHEMAAAGSDDPGTKLSIIVEDVEMYDNDLNETIPFNHENNDLMNTAAVNSVLVLKEPWNSEQQAILSRQSNSGADNATSMEDTDFQEFDTFELSSDLQTVIGTWRLRLDMKSERFRGKSIDQILATTGLIRESDIIERSNERGIFGLVEETIFRAYRNKCKPWPYARHFLPRYSFEKTARLAALSNTSGFKIFEAYELSSDYNILNFCKLRLDMSSKRFCSKSVTDIFNTPGLLLETDVVDREIGDGGENFKMWNELLKEKIPKKAMK